MKLESEHGSSRKIRHPSTKLDTVITKMTAVFILNATGASNLINVLRMQMISMYGPSLCNLLRVFDSPIRKKDSFKFVMPIKFPAVLQ
jgi:hypothetical protein